MDDNLQSQYEQVITYIEQYQSFSSGILRRYIKFMFDSPFTGIREYRALLKHFNPLSDMAPGGYRNKLAELATDEEKQNEYFEIISSDYITDSISSHVLKRFPQFDFGRLKRVHDLKKEQLAGVNFFQIIGVVLTIATVLLKSVPESVVARVWDYPQFELIVFLMTLGTLAYLLVFFLPFWLKSDRAKGTLDFIGYILTYITIKRE